MPLNVVMAVPVFVIPPLPALATMALAIVPLTLLNVIAPLPPAANVIGPLPCAPLAEMVMPPLPA